MPWSRTRAALVDETDPERGVSRRPVPLTRSSIPSSRRCLPLAVGLLAPLLVPAVAHAAGGTISGVVRHSQTKEPLADALVIVQCTCLPNSTWA